MNSNTQDNIVEPDVFSTVIEEIDQFPVEREVMHCGQSFHVSPFVLYATCPSCQTKIKVRSFSAVPEVEDVFEAVFRWMNRPGTSEYAEEHLQKLAEDDDVS